MNRGTAHPHVVSAVLQLTRSSDVPDRACAEAMISNDDIRFVEAGGGSRSSSIRVPQDAIVRDKPAHGLPRQGSPSAKRTGCLMAGLARGVFRGCPTMSPGPAMGGR
jgi:hypothetical protein